MQNVIHISRNESGFIGTYSGPHRAEIIELFGQDSLPLGFTAQADKNKVLAVITKNNPGCSVTMNVR